MHASRISLRAWLTPGPHKGWSPAEAESVGKAMQLARTAKHYTFEKLARATGIWSKTLWQIEKDIIAPLPEQRERIERYLGVRIQAQRRSRTDRAI